MSSGLEYLSHAAILFHSQVDPLHKVVFGSSQLWDQWTEHLFPLWSYNSARINPNPNPNTKSHGQPWTNHCSWGNAMLWLIRACLPCLSYLLLHNKLPPNLAILNSPHLLSHSFHGSGTWAQLSWVLCFTLSHKAARKVSALGPQSHLKAQLGKDPLPNLLSGFCQGSVFYRMLGWGPQTFTDCCLGWRLPLVPHHTVAYSSKHAIWELSLIHISEPTRPY